MMAALTSLDAVGRAIHAYPGALMQIEA